ncbi:MAG: N-acetyl-gamma-glutamyl-phosphate reductase [Cyclobacteriaceae bacterium]|nr:MAG: N-acetyl-gamma-glutamyl-phosphate reductase [Cyclobacteriaceae bacterium]
MIKVGIIGGAGYTGGELLRLLVNHPAAQIDFVHSNSQKGLPVTSVHKDLKGDIDLSFTQEKIPESIDVLFLCMGHGKSKDYLSSHRLPMKAKVIDLSHDFRLVQTGNPFVYGLPELNREEIKKAEKTANPGCFATTIQLALLPLAHHQLINEEIHVHAITGSTGAGARLLSTTQFSWRQNNLSVYKAFEHQHLAEIRQSLEQASKEELPGINFIPVRGDFTKGVFCTAYTRVDESLEQLQKLYGEFYHEHPFTVLSTTEISLKEVINTNKCFLYLQYHDGKLLITSILDNLIKGASGQAVQNMNLMFGLAEDTGLRLKASGF